MIKRTSDKFWFPWWPEKWLWGSIRIECTIEERAIWVDLLCIAAKDDGHIRANEETPYPIEQLAGLLVVPKEVLTSAIEKFINLKDKEGKGKLTRTKEGTLYVTKWEDYQFTDSHKRVLKHRAIKENGTNEDALKAGIQEYLDRQNTSYEIEKICKSGRIDIFFKTGKIPNDQEYIIEVKSNTSADTIKNGIRQLLEYRTEFPRAILYLAFPGELSKKMEEKLEMHNIEKWDCNAKCYNVTEEVTNNITKNNIPNNNIENNNIEYSPEFESFWKHYPKKKEKKDAYFTWKTLTKKQQEEAIIAAEHYRMEADVLKTEEAYIKNPKTFLNKKKEKWRDYLEPPKIQKRMTRQEIEDQKKKDWASKED